LNPLLGTGKEYFAAYHQEYLLQAREILNINKVQFAAIKQAIINRYENRLAAKNHQDYGLYQIGIILCHK